MVEIPGFGTDGLYPVSVFVALFALVHIGGDEIVFLHLSIVIDPSNGCPSSNDRPTGVRFFYIPQVRNGNPPFSLMN